MTAAAVSFTVGPTFTYSGATLSSLQLNLTNNGSNTVNVTGTPALPPGSPMSLSAFSGGTDTVNLGDATHAASGLGSIGIGSGSGDPIDLTIDDSDGAASGTIGVLSTAVAFGTTGPTFDLTNATLASVTLETSNQGGTTINVSGTPVTTNPLTLAMGTGTGNAINLGDATDAAIGLGNVAVTTGIGGSTSLTIDDSADATGQEISVTPTAVTISGSSIFDYTNADLTTLTFDASDANQNTVNVTGTPVTTNPLNLDMGTATGNAVNLGDAMHPASGLGSVAVTTGVGGQTGVWIDDSGGEAGQTIGVTETAVSFTGGPTFDYSGAGLSIVSLKASDAGSNVVTVTGTPVATNPLSLDMGTGAANSVTVGDVLNPASGLGSINFLTEFPGSTSLTVDDSSDASPQTVSIDATSLSFNNGPGFVYNTAALTGLTFDAGSAGGNVITVTGSPQLVADATAINVSAPQAKPDAVTVGDASDPASGLAGNVNVLGSGYASLTIDDSGSTTAHSYALQSNQFTIGAAPGFGFGSLTGLTNLTIKGSSGGDTWSVTGTPTTATTDIETNPGAGKTDPVTIGNESHPASGMGAVAVHGDLSGTTNLIIDDSSDTNSTSPMLEYNTTTNLSDLTALSASTISFDPNTVSYVNLAAGSGSSNTLTVDFSQGNPVPTIFDFEGMQGETNALILQGELPGPTPFGGEIWAPLGPGAAETEFLTASLATTVQFSNLASITDTVPVTEYNFSAPSSAQVINITTGPTIGALFTDEISSGDMPSAFAPIDFANKTNVLIDLRGITNPTYVQPPATSATGLEGLTVWYFGPDSTGQTLTVNGTTPGITNSIELGGNGNTVLVENVTATGPLVITDDPGARGGPNTVDIGDNGDLSNISAGISIGGAADSTNVNVNGSAETTSFGNMLLEMNSGLAELTGVLPGGTLSYNPNDLNSFALSTGTGSDHLSVDFVNGNPFYGGVPGSVPLNLSFNGGGGGDSLGFQDSSGSTTPIFDSETYSANGPGSGVVQFFNNPTGNALVDQGGVQFTNLTPTTDSTPVTNYTFVAPTSGGTIAVTDDSTAGYTLISDPSVSASFESVTYSNKTNVTIDASAVNPNEVFILNNPTPATGQASLTTKLGSGSNTVDVEANGPGIATMLNGGLGSDQVTIAGMGLATGTSASNLAILGGTGANSLRINSQGTGTTATLIPSTSTNPASVSFGAGTGFAFTNMSTIADFATNHAPTIVIPSPLPTIAAQPGLPLVDIPVATFTDGDLIENAGSYQATIEWGDGTAPTSGTITADPGTPGQYIISGSHTYQATGSNSITVTLTDLGGTFQSTLVNSGGVTVPVTTQLDAIPALSGTTDDVSVANLQVLTTSPVTATAGTPVTSILATFSNTNGSTDPSNYSAQINWGDGTGLNGATFTYNGGTFSLSGTHVYAAPGTYLGTIELVAATSGQSLSILLTATVTGLALNEGLPASGPLATAGTSTGSLTVATAAAVGSSPAPMFGGYTAVVDWGDGSAPTAATVTTSGSSLAIGSGGHNFATPGTYTVSVTVYDAPYLVVGQADYSVAVQAPTVQVTTGLTGRDNVPTGDWTVATVSVPVYFQSPGLDYRGYSANVDYGDGSATVPATLSPASHPGATGFAVQTSGHVYAVPGTYTLSVAIRDGAGVIVGTDSATVDVTDPPTPVPGITSGRLSPQSDSGVSDSDGITNITTPTFVGNATGGSVVQVFETPTGSSASPVLIAAGVANDAGAWSATVVNAPMTDGSYQITAVATNSGGSESASLGTVVIDTVAPVITNIVFNRLDGEMQVFYQDNLSGVSLTDLSNGANYQLTARPLNNKIPVRKVIIPTSISVIPAAGASGIDKAIILFNHGKPLRGGHYTIQIFAAGITDIAGNALDGRFYGKLPSGNGGSGGNFVAQITAMPRKVLGPFPLQAGYAKPGASVDNRSALRVERVAKPRVINVVRSQHHTHPAEPNESSRRGHRVPCESYRD